MTTRGFETELTRNGDSIQYRIEVKTESRWKYLLICFLLAIGGAFFVYEYFLNPSIEAIFAPVGFLGIIGFMIYMAKRSEKHAFWLFRIEPDLIEVVYDPVAIHTYEVEFHRRNLARIEVHPDAMGPLLFFDADEKIHEFVYMTPRKEREFLAELLETEWGVEWRREPSLHTRRWVQPLVYHIRS